MNVEEERKVASTARWSSIFIAIVCFRSYHAYLHVMAFIALALANHASLL